MFGATPRRRETIATPAKIPLPTHTPGRRKSVARMGRPPADAAAHSSVPITRMSDSELAEMYSTTIKLCQDNKITAKNTWSLNLIDYMGMLVKDGPSGDGEEAVAAQVPSGVSEKQNTRDEKATNFQIAGVTLDAGVRIYCSRVDSVHTNAFKVLGALSRTSRPNASGDLEDGEDDDDNGEEGGRKKRKRGAHRSGGNTLEGNLETITTRKLETDLSVDPLFQKMSAAFDEGGAKGMLLNNLSVGPRCEVIFDSSETACRENSRPSRAKAPCDDTDGGGGDEESDATPGAETTTYDVSRLLPPTLKRGEAPMTLCPRFMAFYQSRMTAAEVGLPSASTNSAHESGMSQLEGADGVSSAASTAAFDDSGAAFGFEYDDNDIHAGGIPSTASALWDSEAGAGGLEDEDDAGVFGASGRDSESDMNNVAAEAAGNIAGNRALMSGGVDLIEAGMLLHGNSEYSFFDASALSSWAGPQHWRFRALAASANTPGAGSRDGATGAKKRPKGKTAMLLDFSAEAPNLDFAAEFARPENPATCQLTNTVLDGLSEKKVTLPDDQQFRTASLATLFLKPKVAVVAKRRRPQSLLGDEDNLGIQGAAMEDDNFCADAGDFCSGADDDANAIFAFDGDDSPEGMDSGPSLDLVPEPTRVEKIDIGFATVAKKVDVRQLKTGMWSKLRAGAKDEDGEALGENVEDQVCDEDRSSMASVADDVRSGGTQTLQQLVGSMPEYIPEPSLPDVSLSYVFICLLHLANEKTLSITHPEDGSLDDLVIASSKDENLGSLQ